MFTARDLAKEFGVTLHDIAEWNLYKVLPAPVRVNGQLRWREDDIALFTGYLESLIEFEEAGNEPYATGAPAPPVYSTGRPAFDPREQRARELERERWERCKTLSAGADPLPAEPAVTMPELPRPEPIEADHAGD